MFEDILTFAKLAGEVEEGEEELLSPLCRAAEQELTARLKAGTAPEDCAGAFIIAAAWMALADLCVCRQENGITAWSAGDVSVKSRLDAGEQAAVYRAQAARLMRPYCGDEEFAFLGVKG